MKVLVVGTGGVGAAVAAVAKRRDFFERMTFADLDSARPQALVEREGDSRFVAAQADASDKDALVALLRESEADAILNAADPRFNPPILEAAYEYGCTYLDMAMTLSGPSVMLGAEELEADERWRERGLLALAGIGVEPGLADVFARYAADHLFDEIDEVGIRDGADLVVEGYDFAPTFSIWTTIEECLNPPLVWEKERGFYTTEPFSEPELFEFPEGIGVIECVNVEHEEVVLVPRAIECRRVTFKYGLGTEFIEVLQTLHKLGLDSTEPVRFAEWTLRRARWSPPRCPTRRPSATGCAARRAPARSSRGSARTAPRARSTSTTSPTTSGRCGSTAIRRSSSRRPSTR